MPFKIVQTSENNRNRLFSVPSNWEEENILKWPRKHVTRYIENEFSTPEPDWKTMRCTVKRRNIPSYQTAEYVIGEMLNHTDTEDETRSKQTIPHKRPLQELNLNILADEIICPAKETAVSSVGPSEVIAETAATSVEIGNGVYQFHIVEENQNNTNQKHQCCANVEQNLAIQNVILSNQTQILEQLNSLKKVENTILQKVALFSVQLEDAVLQMNADRDSKVTELIDARNTSSNSAFYFKPVNNIQQLNDLEKQLSDSHEKQKFKNTFSVICSGGKGIDCAYTLADVLFSREFLCQCTWSGGSRGNEVKIAWKSYKNILSFFWEMINSWDKTYTMNENSTFFKNILKNSKKRKMAKNQRASTSRKRVKFSNPSPANDAETTDEDEDISFNENEQENEDNPIKNNTTEENEQNKEEEEKKDVNNENTIDNIEEEEKFTDKEMEEENNCNGKNRSNKTEIEEEKTTIGSKEKQEEEEGKKEEEKKEDEIDEPAMKEIEIGQHDFDRVTKDFEVKEKYETPIKEIGDAQNDFDKVTKDSEGEINSEKKKANTAEEAKRIDESHEPSTSSSSNYKVKNSNPKMKIAKLSSKKSNPKMKIAKLTKIKKEKMHIVKINKNVAKVENISNN